MNNKEPRYFKDLNGLQKAMAVVGMVLGFVMMAVLALDIFTDHNLTTVLLGVLAVFWLSRAVMNSAGGSSPKAYLLLVGLTMLLDIIYVFN